MLRRLKNADGGDSDSMRNGAAGDDDGSSPRHSTGADQMSSLQRYRSQTMKDYGLMIEYKHLRQHVPGGIYVLPSFDHSRTWYGTIFIHTGLYRNGVFKFTIELPENYNGPGTYPRIVFNTKIFHPYVHPETKELDLTPKFPQWDPELHYMVAVLTYLKSIFYMKEFPPHTAVVHPNALDVFRRDPEKFVTSVEGCVEESLEHVYTNDQASTIRFTKPSPAHESLRRELFAQLTPNETTNETIASEMDTLSPSSVLSPTSDTTLMSEDGEAKSHSHGANDEDDVVGLGVPHGSDDGDDATRQQREEEYMDEMIMKHRSEFQSFVARALDVNVSAASGNGGGSSKVDHRENLQNVPPSRGSEKSTPRLDPNFRTPQPKRPNTSERLLQLSRTERTDRMRLAELSDVRNEKLGRDAILRWNPNAKRADELDNRTYGAEGAGRRNGTPSTRGRERSHTTPTTPTTARMLGEISKDFVQQAIDFTNHELLTDDDDDADRRDAENEDDDDDDDLDLEPPLQTDVDDLIDRQLRGPLSNKKMRKYVKHVKHMETTIAQLVQQKEELIRNQAEFDKHASGMFPTLENLNNQLSQLVQDRLQQSQVNIKDDLDGELRSLRVRLNELEADARQRRNDAELNDQKNQLDMAQIKTEVASLGTTGSLQNHKIELIMSQIKQLQQEIHQSVQVTKSLSTQYQTIDNRITTIQVSLKEETRSQSAQTPKSALGWVALVVAIVAIVMALLTADRCSGWFGRCRPLT